MSARGLREALEYRPPGWPERVESWDPDWLLLRWRPEDPREAAERLQRALEDCEPRWREAGCDNSPYPDVKTWLGDGATIGRDAYLDDLRWGIGYTDEAVTLRLFVPDPRRTIQSLTSLLPPRWELRDRSDSVKRDAMLKIVAEAAILAIFPHGVPRG